MPTFHAMLVDMGKPAKRTQYTIRGIPAFVDRALRARARREGRSLDDVVQEALRAWAGEGPEQPLQHDLDDLIGTWEEDRAFDAVLREQTEVDEARGR